jgi:uncharacterized surface protein with fasciclin (FAS1) repeats
MLSRRLIGTFALAALTACGGAPKDEAAPMEDTMAAAAESASGDIIDVATAAGSFNTLAAALTAAGLVETLQGPGPFTVLAPTDEAFAKIPEADLQALLADKDALTKVLTYHVIAGNVPSSDVVTLTEATTVEGRKITIAVVDGKVVINGNSTVVTPDVAASNGVIHVIDAVLMPPQM